MAANVPAGVVKSIKGEVFARNAEGKLRRLAAGDSIFEGEVIVTANGSLADIAMHNGASLIVNEQQSVAVDTEVTAAALDTSTGAIAPLGSTEALKIIQAATPGSALDINALLENEAAAAGFSASGSADGGHNFVNLLRILENLSGVEYEIPVNPTGNAPVLEGLLVPEIALAAIGTGISLPPTVVPPQEDIGRTGGPQGNNGFGDGDQDAPGNSLENNNAENSQGNNNGGNNGNQGGNGGPQGNNGFGDGDQDAPGGSLENNNAENSQGNNNGNGNSPQSLNVNDVLSDGAPGQSGGANGNGQGGELDLLPFEVQSQSQKNQNSPGHIE
jgi:hypothetical protein